MYSKAGKKYHIPQVPFYGEVVDIDDPRKSARVKARVMGIDDDTPPENLPWCEQAVGAVTNQIELPVVGRFVEIIRHEDGTCRWKHLDFKDKGLISLIGEDDYTKCLVLAYKNMADFDGDGIFSILWSFREGFRVMLKNALMHIADDETVLLKSADTALHVQDGKISIGSVSESAEPCVLGDKNKDALGKINDAIEKHIKDIASGMDKISAAASGNPYTAALSVPINELSITMRKNTEALKKSISDAVPKTLSKIITVD